MSHLKERTEKICLNCNSEIVGRYCHVCGQENIEPYESVWHLIQHFFNDITHFDGKFFTSLKYLVSKPGKMSKLYMLGKRAAYLNPVRMYLFTSAIFFLIFFAINNIDDKKFESKIDGYTMSQVNAMDSTSFVNFTKRINQGKPLSRSEFVQYMDTTTFSSGVKLSSWDYKNKAAYDSVLKSGKIKHNWLERKVTYKKIEVYEKYHNDTPKIIRAFLNAVMHSFPQMLFVSLPLFALMLKLLYVRRKNFYYSSHLIFSIHLYIFVFILLLMIIGLGELNDLVHWTLIQYLTGLAFVYILYYEFRAMKNFYDQGWGKTFLKFTLLNVAMLFMMLVLFVLFAFFSLLKL